MGLEVSVWINDGSSRRQVQVEVVKSNKLTVWVLLPDGNVVKRKRARDIVGWND